MFRPVLLALLLAAGGAGGAGGAEPGRPDVVPVCTKYGCRLVRAADLSWVMNRDESEAYLYEKTKQIGAYCVADGSYWPLLDYAKGKWGDHPVKPPIAPPAKPTTIYPSKEVGQLPAGDYGVDLSKLGKGSRYKLHVDGVEHHLHQAAALEAIEKGLPDDAGKLRLTMIGSKEARAQAEKDYREHPDWADIRERCLLWSVEPTHWSVANTGFALPPDGKCMLYLQAAAAPGAKAAKTLYRDLYASAGDVEVIRTKFPDYDLAKDPGRKSPATQTTLSPVALGLVAFVLAGGALLFLARKT